MPPARCTAASTRARCDCVFVRAQQHELAAVAELVADVRLEAELSERLRGERPLHRQHTHVGRGCELDVLHDDLALEALAHRVARALR